jgi:hypothetical protein
MAVTAQELILPNIDLPPAYSLVFAAGDAFAQACAMAGEAGAGTFVWAPRADILDFAVVLEPEEPLAAARRAVFAGMAALADGVAAAAPPEKPVDILWPTTLRYDGARIGGGRLAWPGNALEDRVPDWLVFSAQVLTACTSSQEPGMHPDVTWLAEEGFDPADTLGIMASFARHLMTAFDRWTEFGFGAVAEAYLERLHGAEGARLAETGDLLVHGTGAGERRPLVPGLVAPEWFDPATGTPRL